VIDVIAAENQEISGAIGTIQSLTTTAKELNTSTAPLSNMSRTNQLKYVEKYLRERTKNGKDIKTPQDLVAAIFTDTDMYNNFLKDP